MNHNFTKKPFCFYIAPLLCVEIGDSRDIGKSKCQKWQNVILTEKKKNNYLAGLF